MKKLILEHFLLDGIEYYRHMGKYYEDNGTVCNVISDRVYRFCLMNYYLKEGNSAYMNAK